MKLFTNRNLAVIIGLLCCVLSKAQTMDDFIWDFEWLEPDNRIEIVVGEPHQLRYNSRTNKSLAFTKEYAESWVHYDFSPMQHVVESPTGYSIDKNGVVTGLVAGRYAIKYTGLIQAKSGTDKWLYITVVNERTEKESNNTFDTANEITSKIRFGLYNSSDVDYFKYSNPGLKWGDIVTFKIHYTGYREAPFAYRYSTFSGTELSGSGALALQDQECRSLVFSGTTVYLEVYYDQSRTQYFQYGEEFVAEVFINDIPASEYGKEEDNGSEGEGAEEPETREYVDLGLPSGLLWATTNVGAKKAEECGSFFAWGETSSKSSYSWDTYKYANGSETSLSKYCSSYTYGNVDYKEVLDKEDDAATVNWGETWRTPTLAESQELINYCTWAYTTLNGANGYKVTGPNGNYIFLPSTGVKEYDNTFFRTDVCMLTSTIFNAPNGNPSSASILYCENGSPHYWYGWSRCWGYTVRPVTGFNSSGISTPTTNTTDEIVAIYDANGHKLSSAQKGINIIKYKDGTSKIIVK